jgi:hypothetical protein
MPFLLLLKWPMWLFREEGALSTQKADGWLEAKGGREGVSSTGRGWSPRAESHATHGMGEQHRGTAGSRVDQRGYSEREVFACLMGEERSGERRVEVCRGELVSSLCLGVSDSKGERGVPGGEGRGSWPPCSSPRSGGNKRELERMKVMIVREMITRQQRPADYSEPQRNLFEEAIHAGDEGQRKGSEEGGRRVLTSKAGCAQLVGGLRWTRGGG